MNAEEFNIYARYDEPKGIVDQTKNPAFIEKGIEEVKKGIIKQIEDHFEDYIEILVDNEALQGTCYSVCGRMTVIKIIKGE